MKEIYNKYNKSLKIFLIAFGFMLFAGKLISGFSPYILMKNIFDNTVRKHKSSFSKPYLISAQLSYKSKDGKNKIINALFDDSVFGVSLDGPDSVYYTIPVDNIKSLLKSDYINSLFLSGTTFNKIPKTTIVIPSLLSAGLSKNIDFNFITKTISEARLKSDNTSILSGEKRFTFSIPSEVISEIITSSFSFEPKGENAVSIKNEDYFFDVKISDNSFKNITCITPHIDGTSYYIMITLDYPRIFLSAKNSNGAGETLNIALRSESGENHSKFKEKSIYSLTVGELIRIGEFISDRL